MTSPRPLRSYTDGKASQFIGRFAPSPTGALHLGSLTTAVASFCHIKSLGGKWLVRLEDTDFERCKPAYSTQILKDLEMLGLHWDDTESHQSHRLSIYQDYLSALAPFSYVCDCSRKTLAPYGEIYPRLCLHQNKDKTNNKIRLITPDATYGYHDELQGVVFDNPQTQLGDVVVRRQNGIFNYILTAAIDDGLQNITHIVRGLDIAMMTTTQIFIRKILNLPTVSHHAHLPLIVNANGQKLSKQNLAAPIDTTNPTALLRHALRLLGQAIPDDDMDKDELLTYAVTHWQNTPLKYQQNLAVV